MGGGGDTEFKIGFNEEIMMNKSTFVLSLRCERYLVGTLLLETTKSIYIIKLSS